MLRFINKKKVAIGFLFLVILIGNNCKTSVSNQLEKREVEIYETLIAENSKDIVLIDNSIIEAFGVNDKEDLKSIFDKIKDDTSDSFLKSVKVAPNIRKDFRLDSGNLIVTKNRKQIDLETVGISLFSRVGFSDDGKQAVVWFTKGWNSIGMSGGFYLLRKQSGVWAIEEESEKIVN